MSNNKPNNNNSNQHIDIFTPRHKVGKGNIVIPGPREVEIKLPSPGRNNNSHVTFGSMRTLYEETPSSIDAAMAAAQPSERKSFYTYLSEKFCFSKKN
ncbi:hypothetical protein KPH14_011100 [Odynerus spinipes]|uniref:Uncharacterized protein n=1 Tax=Odynerus spinipes TaxID=1348599 RepID=A0AAD9RHJ4_9HYME|nr:hypothetical protein KPH14_011100 [Odynerus spinipes]